jgi:hypothetical protein
VNKDTKPGRDAFLRKFEGNPEALRQHMTAIARERGRYSRIGRAVDKVYRQLAEEAAPPEA